ncbi:MAG: hypothetical protein J07HB67_00270 [halophilic archaeon J07HB67]|nr:MAG: hypothetical protein J07HB67_00270 [halophilic archaeon J07HB67]
MDCTEHGGEDTPRGQGAPSQRDESLGVYFDVIADDDIAWGRVYFGLSLVSLVVAVGVPPFVVASVHLVHSRRRRLRAVGRPPEE